MTSARSSQPENRQQAGNDAQSTAMPQGSGMKNPGADKSADMNVTMKKKPVDYNELRPSNPARAMRKFQTGRHLVALGITALYFLLYYVVGTPIRIVSTNVSGAAWGSSEAVLQQSRLGTVSTWLGIRQEFSFMVIVLAVIIGISEFSYLFSSVKMDFYESQPVSRRKRFRDLYWHGVGIFLVPFLVSLFLALVIAFGMRAMSAGILAEAMIEMVREIIAFLSAYNLTILAAVLCGNPFVAVCVAAFFFLAEIVYHLAWELLSTLFLPTYVSDTLIAKWMLSPLYNVMLPYISVDSRGIYSDLATPAWQLRLLVRESLPADLASAAVAIAALALAWLGFRKRKAEAAGSSIVYRPVRVAVRIVTSLGAALLAGILASNILVMSSAVGTNQKPAIVGMLLIMFLAAIIVAGVIEVVYTFNVRKFFAHPVEVLAACIAAAAIFAGFRSDIMGFNRYIPAIEDVDYASLYAYEDSSNFSYMDAYGSQDPQGYFRDGMHLTNVADVEAVVKIAQPYQVSHTNDETISGWGATVYYHMKNGRVVARQILIPYTIDAKLMDAIVGSDAYKESVFPVYQKRVVNGVADNGASTRTEDGTAGSSQDGSNAGGSVITKARLDYTNGLTTVMGDGSLYAEFAAAYRKDLERYYSFSLAREQKIIGTVSLTSDNEGIYDVYNVYPQYTNTIAFLQENGLYLLPAGQCADQIGSAEVSVYSDDGISAEQTYEKPDQIREILAGVGDTYFGSSWRTDEDMDVNYNITFQMNRKTVQGTENGGSYSFAAGKVPAFVSADLPVPEESGESGE